jgi:hypothetical protein
MAGRAFELGSELKISGLEAGGAHHLDLGRPGYSSEE